MTGSSVRWRIPVGDERLECDSNLSLIFLVLSVRNRWGLGIHDSFLARRLRFPKNIGQKTSQSLSLTLPFIMG
jgi:hypothetical protein